MDFKELKLTPPIMKALKRKGYTKPTEIQKESIPIVLEKKDLLGCAQTGTGKTAAFAIPIIQLLNEEKYKHKEKGLRGNDKRKIRCLVLTPTRELALQVYESFCDYGHYTDIKANVIFGGVSQKPQEKSLKNGIDVVVATPGRLKDLMGQGLVNLKDLDTLVLDEADRMLDMGFLPDVKKIISKLPTERQTLLFSATMPADISKMAQSILKNPETVTVTPVASTVEAIIQKLYYVDKVNKKDLLLHVLKENPADSVLVFTKTKHKANDVAKLLSNKRIPSMAIHGNKSQGARQNALNSFKKGQLRVLVATDIAARGLDISELALVINFELPDVAETYVHRIGRTGRAGNDGEAITFCDFTEMSMLSEIEHLTGQYITEAKDNPYPLKDKTVVAKSPMRGRRSFGSRGRGGRR
ncbi:MAG: DEAD/DEAH box helicase [Anaerovoracaceae bacterium]